MQFSSQEYMSIILSGDEGNPTHKSSLNHIWIKTFFQANQFQKESFKYGKK